MCQLSRTYVGAGELTYSYNAILEGSPIDSTPIEAAKFIVEKLPNRSSPYMFSVIYSKGGTQMAYGHIYGQKKFAIIYISTIGGASYRVQLLNGEFKELK